MTINSKPTITVYIKHIYNKIDTLTITETDINKIYKLIENHCRGYTYFIVETYISTYNNVYTSNQNFCASDCDNLIIQLQNKLQVIL